MLLRDLSPKHVFRHLLRGRGLSPKPAVLYTHACMHISRRLNGFADETRCQYRPITTSLAASTHGDGQASQSESRSRHGHCRHQPRLPQQLSPLHLRVMRDIRNKKLVQPGSTLLVAVSGGQDSVCLAQIMLDLARLHEWQLHIAHCDHRWRTDSAQNADHVAGLAGRWGLPFHLRTASVPPPNEASARTWRYDSLAGLALELSCDTVLTGHTATDRAETLLFNLTRGAGADGMQALAWSRTLVPGVAVVRPMLGLSRQQTADFCASAALPIWEDSTNHDNKYRRNRIRNELLPYLRTHFNPCVDEVLARTAEVLQDEVTFLEQQTSLLVQAALDAGALVQAQAEAQAQAKAQAKSRRKERRSGQGGMPTSSSAATPVDVHASSNSRDDTEVPTPPGCSEDAVVDPSVGMASSIVLNPGPRQLAVHTGTLAAAPVALQRRAMRQLMVMLVPDVAPTHQAIEELLQLVAASEAQSGTAATSTLPRGMRAHLHGQLLLLQLQESTQTRGSAGPDAA